MTSKNDMLNSMTSKKLCNLNHIRGANQKKNMEKALKAKECIFCPKNIAKYHTSPIERKGQFWLITKNDYPYDGSELHYLFIYNQHIDSLSKIKPEAMTELIGHLKWLEKKFKIKGGAVLIRFGDSDRTSASITHLHGHFIVGGKRKKGKESMM